MTITTSQLASGLATLLGLSTEDAATLATLFTDWDPTTPTDLATLVTDFVTASGVRDESYNDWWVGSATGGPASDGYYPITVFGGGVVNLPCPAKMMRDLGTLSLKGETATLTTLNAIASPQVNDMWKVLANDHLYGRTTAGTWLDLGPAGIQGETGRAAWLTPVDWATGLALVVGPPCSIVVKDGVTYAATVDHTAGVFATDLAAGKLIKVAGAGADGEDGREVELQTGGGYIQWRYAGETGWTNLVALSTFTGPAGNDGDNGTNGTNGTDGTDGREVELQTGGGYIQWRYAGETGWTNLVALSTFTGPTGPAAWTEPTAWVTGGDYVVGPPASLVTLGGETFVCVIPHTAGTFATDLAAGRWVKVAAKGADGAGAGDVLKPVSAGNTGKVAVFSNDDGDQLESRAIGAAAAGDILDRQTGDARYRTEAQVSTAISTAIDALVAGAPGALDTLAELAAALGDEQDAVAALTAAVAGKQASSANLTAFAGLTGASDKLAYFTGASALALADISAFGRSLIDDADGGSARTTLGLGTAATLNHGTSAGNLVRLDPSTGKLPAVDGSALINLPSGGGVVPIAEVAISSGASGFAFTATHINGTYEKYLVVGNAMSSGSLELLLSLVQAGTAVTDHVYSRVGQASNTTSLAVAADNSGVAGVPIVASGAIGGTYSWPLSFEIWLDAGKAGDGQIHSASVRAKGRGDYAHWAFNTELTARTTGDLNGLNVSMASGTLTGGVARLYGFKK